MDDALRVRGGQALRHLHAQVDGLAPGEGAALHPLAQRLALQQLHDRVGQPLVVPEVVDGDDVRVGERRQRACLALEAGEGALVLGQARRQHLDRDLAMEARVAGAVHLAHAARAQRSDDLVAVVQADARRDHAR